jgi:hypothetical protein
MGRNMKEFELLNTRSQLRRAATPTGEPLNPRTAYTNWKQLLERADVPERRLHDAAAISSGLLLGVTERTVMAVMG